MSQETYNNAPQRQFSRRKTVVYSLLPALLLFGGVEGCARIIELWRPPLTLDYGWGFNEDSRVFVPTGVGGATMKTRPEKMASFAPQEFQMPKPPGTYRMFMLGGSNVNYMYWHLQAMAERLTNMPGETRRFEIINMGGMAYGSHRLRILIAEALAYEPDLILIYAGHNEFEELHHQALVDLDRMGVQRVAYSLAILRALRDIRAAIAFDMAWRVYRKDQTAFAPEIDVIPAARHEFTPEEIADRMELFRENLDAIVAACQERGVPVIMSTVATNLWAPDLHPRHAEEMERIVALYAAGDYAAGMQAARDILVRTKRHQASDTENAIIREVAAAHGVPLVEGEKMITDAEPHGVPGETLLSDRCHLTEAGRDIVLGGFEAVIRQITGGATP